LSSDQPLVSIIIPCRNAAPWLAEAIESCLHQTWRPVEIIVIDNGSIDASRAVAEAYVPHSVVLLDCAQEGASAARNAGLERASGELIQFLDADDVLDRDKIRTQVERLSAAPPLSVASGAWARFRQSPAEARFAAEPVWRDLSGEEFLISSWLGGGMMANFAWLTPRAVIDKAGPWDERLSLCDDGEFFSRVALAASGIVFCGDARGYYRSGGGATLSGRRDRAALMSEFNAVELSCERLLARCSSDGARKACATHYQRFIFSTYPQLPHLIRIAERRVAELGGSELQIGGGTAFTTISRCFGWKAAKRCQRPWLRLRHRSGTPEAAARR
jgi:hypothetical protein